MITAKFTDDVRPATLLHMKNRRDSGGCGVEECCGIHTWTGEFEMTREEFEKLDLTGCLLATEGDDEFIF